MFARVASAAVCLVLLVHPVIAQNAGVVGGGVVGRGVVGRGVVEGSVIDSATRSGIAGVTVKLYTRLGVRYETTTDAAGRFTVREMKEDDYDSSFERDGFAPPEASRVLFKFKPLLRVNGKNPARLDVEMVPWAKIRGRVVDADGNPAAGAAVTLDGPRIGPSGEETTDGDGTFTFNKLLPGSYTILARPKATPLAKDARDNRMEFVPTYFPSVVERLQASPVIVRAGADASGNEIQ
jgi:hypothetical protein